MANFCSGVKVRLFGGAAGSMSSSVTSSFWARSIKGVELVKVMVSVLPVSPWREERLRQVSHVSLTDRVWTAASRSTHPIPQNSGHIRQCRAGEMSTERGAHSASGHRMLGSSAGNQLSQVERLLGR